MQNQVTIVADDNGNVIRQSKNNAEFGYVRVIQDAVQYGANGWVNRKTRSALILGKMEDLKEIGLDKMDSLPGKIVVKESTEPFSQTDPDRDLKIAGSTGIICCTADGEPIYRTTFYDATGEQLDELKAHANGYAIREANGNGAAKIAKSEFNLDKAPKKAKAEEFDTKDDEIIESVSEDVIEDSAENVELEVEEKDTFEL